MPSSLPTSDDALTEQARQMKLETENRADLRILTVDAERIDAAVAIRFKETVREATQDAPPRVVLNLSRVEFIDSSGLGAIVAAMKLLPTGSALELACLRPSVDKVFRMTRMDSVFVIHTDTDSV